MILIFLLQLSLQPNLLTEVKHDLKNVSYDSLFIEHKSTFTFVGKKWKKRNPFHPGTNLIKVKDGKRFKLVPIKVRIYKNVPVATIRIKRSTKISANKFKISLKEITYTSSPLKPNFKEDRISSRLIKQGDILTTKNTKKSYDGKFGEVVEYVLHVNRLTLKQSGKLMKDSYIGDNVVVKLTETGKKVKGWFTKKGLVKYEK